MITRNHRGSKGFTIIELLVVISIIAFLSAIISASLSQARTKAYVASHTLKREALYDALDQYSLENGHFPYTSHQGFVCVGPYLKPDGSVNDTCGFTGDDMFWNSIAPYLAAPPTLQVGVPTEYNFFKYANYVQWPGNINNVWWEGGVWLFWDMGSPITQTECPSPSEITEWHGVWQCKQFLGEGKTGL